MIIIKKEDPVPLYIQIKNDLIDQIKNGRYKVDDKIPSENELKETYDVSQITVRKALGELVNEGYLYKIQGKGTFVARRSINRMLNMMSFTEEMRAKDLDCTSKILDLSETLNPRINQELNLQSTDKLFKVKRLRFMDEQPIALQTSYLPEKIISREELQVIYEAGSLYKVLNSSGIEPRRAEEKYNAEILDSRELKNLFQAEKNIAVFRVKRHTYDQGGNLFEYAVSFLRGDIYTMEVKLEKNN